MQYNIIRHILQSQNSRDLPTSAARRSERLSKSGDIKYHVSYFLSLGTNYTNLYRLLAQYLIFSRCAHLPPSPFAKETSTSTFTAHSFIRHLQSSRIFLLLHLFLWNSVLHNAKSANTMRTFRLHLNTYF